VVREGFTLHQSQAVSSPNARPLQKNEMLIRIDDAAKESQFHIKAMALRPEWDRIQILRGSRS
jgi:hypothetical protein